MHVGVIVRVCDIMGPTNGTYYIDEKSWEISLLVPLINTQHIVITQFFSFCAPSLFLSFSFFLSLARFHFSEYIKIRTHTNVTCGHTQHKGKLQAFMQRVKDVYEMNYQQIMINNCIFSRIS